MSKYADDVPVDTHPSQELRVIHTADMRLRAAKFTIYRRPPAGPTLWRHRDGSILTQAQALASVKAGKGGK